MEVARHLLKPNGKITLLHVIDEIPGFVAAQLPEGTFSRHREQAERELKQLADSCDPKPDAMVVTGHSSRTIVEEGAKMKADCIVISSHKPGIEDYFLGSTAGHVVRHAGVAVHVLR
jgi:nucleotide-binding universal stress UspA family protein